MFFIYLSAVCVCSGFLGCVCGLYRPASGLCVVRVVWVVCVVCEWCVCLRGLFELCMWAVYDDCVSGLCVCSGFLGCVLGLCV